MIAIPESLPLAEAVDRLRDEVVTVWSAPSVHERLRSWLPWPVAAERPELTPGSRWLLAAGGGTLLDQAKLWRAATPGLRLAALPTLWGSGAEATSIAVWREGAKKRFRIGPELLPDLIVRAPQLADTVSPERRRIAAGDVWSHSLEGFLSPLGNAEIRSDLAQLIRRLADLPLDGGAEWFEPSALAAAGQARASVGAVHGMAHVLEGVLEWPHARLCATFLLPALRFARERSPNWSRLNQHGLDERAILERARQLFDPAAYAAALPALASNWTAVLRDPCTRTNSALLRPEDLAFFRELADE